MTQKANPKTHKEKAMKTNESMNKTHGNNRVDLDSLKAVMADQQQYALNGIAQHHARVRYRAEEVQSEIAKMNKVLQQLQDAVDSGEPEPLYAVRCSDRSISVWFEHTHAALSEMQDAYRQYLVFAYKLNVVNEIAFESDLGSFFEA